MSEITIVGVDPGGSGGLVRLSSEAPHFMGHPMPKDGAHLRQLLESWKPGHLIMEKVIGRGGWSASANFTFGYNAGILWLVQALQIPYTMVPPQTWQRHVIRGVGEKDTKKAAAIRFAQLFPSVTLEGNKKVQEGIRDAALIAFYGQCILGGTLATV